MQGGGYLSGVLCIHPQDLAQWPGMESVPCDVCELEVSPLCGSWLCVYFCHGSC